MYVVSLLLWTMNKETKGALNFLSKFISVYRSILCPASNVTPLDFQRNSKCFDEVFVLASSHHIKRIVFFKSLPRCCFLILHTGLRTYQNISLETHLLYLKNIIEILSCDTVVLSRKVFTSSFSPTSLSPSLCPTTNAADSSSRTIARLVVSTITVLSSYLPIETILDSHTSLLALEIFLLRIPLPLQSVRFLRLYPGAPAGSHVIMRLTPFV